jgi:uncharacterized protein with PQ loop repeat
MTDAPEPAPLNAGFRLDEAPIHVVERSLRISPLVAQVHHLCVAEVRMGRFKSILLTILLLHLLLVCGCQDLVPRDTSSLFIPRLHRSEIFGFLAGLGTTFAAVPDLIAMLRRRSSAGMNPRMAAIMAVFQILWVYYGLLIASRPVIAWNVVGVLINSLNVAAYRHFASRERATQESHFTT